MGHGHVVPNEDGSKARCGGPAICSECAAEQAAQKEPEIKIHSMSVENGNIDMKLSTDKLIMLQIASSLAGCLKEHGAPNFVVMDVHHPEEGWLSLTIQRKNGKSPAEKIADQDYRYNLQQDTINRLKELVIGLYNLYERTNYKPKDNACEMCVRENYLVGDSIKDGFTCVYHRARSYVSIVTKEGDK